MPEKSRIRRGWHFLQIPGPSNTPERIRTAMSQPTLDHRGPEFGQLVLGLLKGLKQIFHTAGEVIIYPSSGTGAWEASLMNLFSPGDRILAFETGHFATKWKELANRLGIEVVWIESDWRRGADPEKIKASLLGDTGKGIQAVMVVHNETSTGVTTDIQSIRQILNETGHPALLLVDVVSSLMTITFLQDEWGVDVAIGASQKGLMLPPGLSFNSINQRAYDIAQKNQAMHSYWQWSKIIELNQAGFFPYTPASSLLQGLEEALSMIFEEGEEQIFNRHCQIATACRVALSAWGLENQAVHSTEFSNSTTAVRLPDGFDADELRRIILENYNMSLGKGLGKIQTRVFRIGHLGDFNQLMLMATLSGVEMGLKKLNVPISSSGTQHAIEFLAAQEI